MTVITINLPCPFTLLKKTIENNPESRNVDFKFNKNDVEPFHDRELERP